MVYKNTHKRSSVVALIKILREYPKGLNSRQLKDMVCEKEPIRRKQGGMSQREIQNLMRSQHEIFDRSEKVTAQSNLRVGWGTTTLCIYKFNRKEANKFLRVCRAEGFNV